MTRTRSAPQNPPLGAAPSVRTERWRRAIPLLLALAPLLAYANSLDGVFVYDDRRAILDNPHIRALWPPSLVLGAPPDASVARRPVVGASFALNYAFGGFGVRGYHAVNLAIHVAATLLVFALLRRALDPPPRERAAGKSDASLRDARGSGLGIWLAASITCLWSVHPLLTDAIDYVVQRTELLMSLFLLLTIYGVARAAESARAAWWLALSVAACALGMASKEVMVVAPLLALLYDRAFLSGSFARALHARGRAYAALAATWLVLAAIVVLTPSTQRAGSLARLLDPLDYLRAQAGVILHYLRLAVWPSSLSIVYDDWTIPRTLASAAVPGAIVLGLLALSAWLVRARPRLGFAGAWFFLILAPTSSLLPIPSEIAAERRMYLPLVGVVAVIVLAFEAALRALARPRARAAAASGPHRAAGLFGAVGWVAAGVPIVAAALALGATTQRRNLDYRDERALWRDSLVKRPRSATARVNLGYLLERERRLPEALALYREALTFRPESGVAHSNVGAVLLAIGRPQEALVSLREAVRCSPDLARAHINLGSALIVLKQVDEGVRVTEEAVRLDPMSADANSNLGFGYVLQGRPDAAFPPLVRAIELNPNSVSARLNMGIALNAAHRPDEAIAPLTEAIRLDPSQSQAHLALAKAFAESGRFEDAARSAARARDLALAAGNEDLARGIEERVKDYEAHRVSRPDPSPTGAD